MPVVGVTLWPFIFVREDSINDYIMIQHERIHLAQYKELWVIGFWPVYLYYWFKGVIIYKDLQKAYMSIPLEKEAYANARNEYYLCLRKKFNWRKL